jgi:hypothetical protein
MNFAVESAAMRAAEVGEQSASNTKNANVSPTSLIQKKNFIYGRPQTAPSTFTFNPNQLMTPEQDRQVWSMMQSRLFSKSHIKNNAFSMYNQSSNPFVLNSATIPKQLKAPTSKTSFSTITNGYRIGGGGSGGSSGSSGGGRSRNTTASRRTTATNAAASNTSSASNTPSTSGNPRKKIVEPSKPQPLKQMSAKRKQWLAQLMAKKQRQKERKELLAKDPHAFDHELVKPDKKKNSRKARGKNKRNNSDVSDVSDYESDGGSIKFRRTSKASKVDSSSEMSDNDSSSSRRWGNGNTTSDELDEIFDDLNVHDGSSGSSDVGEYTLDHMQFLDESNNVRRNQGRHRKSDQRPNTTPGIFGSTNLDLSMGIGESATLDDSLRFWESTALSAQQDLQSFVSDYASPPRKDNVSPVGPAVVDTLFDLNREDLDDDQLEKSWMQATSGSVDPLAFSVGSVSAGSIGNSLVDSQMLLSKSMITLTKSMEDELDMSL